MFIFTRQKKRDNDWWDKFFNVNYRHRVCVSAGDGWHDWSIDNTEIADPAYFELWVDDGIWLPVGSHLAGSNNVIEGNGILADEAVEVFIRQHRLPSRIRPHGEALTAWERLVVKPGTEPLESRCLTQFQSNLHTFYHHFGILLFWSNSTNNKYNKSISYKVMLYQVLWFCWRKPFII